MTDIKQRAEDLGDRPDIARWHKRLRKVLAEMPHEVWLYAASGTLCLMAKTEDGHHAVHPGERGYDQDAVIATLPGECDGGDW